VAERPPARRHRGGIGDRRLYLCTADRPDLASFVKACIDGGVDVVQLRDKVLDARPLLERAAIVQEVCAAAGVPFVLNDRPDLALALGADGVHVGQDDAPPALARHLLGDDVIVGFSTHAPGELDAALAEPVDYISTGPVNETPTKPGRAGTGLEYLRYATASAGDLPFFVTGGVTPDTLPAMLEAGARRFVVVRDLTEAEDPAANAARLRSIIDAAW
jgi:thiamine-phosphate pyrophosphorylase